ncbi:hypothetical protein [Armatimonas rosea]|uniref:Putative HAF family extracellular repeat protein n=1 Tax=Armatimonas rosea TaxID=685828 RepID=A0A7W9W6X8_ARMRO|nr:hypothetical protein [Armatimonas rosea]MBB6051919.1 putative HAF family extracellular repeat protein [Armatimonas rosea]
MFPLKLKSVAVVGSFVALTLAGCSGAGLLSHGSAGSSSPTVAASGSARFTIVWPETTGRLIPLGANSIKIVLSGPETVTKVVARPTGGSNTTTITFTGLKIGSYTATTSAYPSTDGTGVAQATGAVSVAIARDQTTTTTLTMDSTIATVEIGGAGTTGMNLGESRTLTATAKNAAGQVVLVAPSLWQWSGNNAASFTLTPGGESATLTANAPGTVTLSLKETESNQVATLTVKAFHVTFEGLGDLPGGEFRSVALAVSADGSVVVGNSTSGNVTGSNAGEAFRWTRASGMVGLGDLPGGFFRSSATAVSADGTVVAGIGDNAVSAARVFRWTQAGGMVNLGAPASSAICWARGISADGTRIVGTTTLAAGVEYGACYWTEATGFVELNDLAGGPVRCEATAISQDGRVLVGYGTSDKETSCSWNLAGEITALAGVPRGTGSALGASGDGTVIVGYADTLALGRDGLEAYRWSASGGTTFLGDFPGGGFAGYPASYARGVSADGNVVVGMGMSTEGSRVFVWTQARGLQDLGDILRSKGIDLSAWAGLINATDHAADVVATISADGTTIVGTAFHNGNREAFRAYKSDGFLNP